MDIALDGGIESDPDSIDEDALRDVECWSSNSEPELEMEFDKSKPTVVVESMDNSVGLLLHRHNLRTSSNEADYTQNLRSHFQLYASVTKGNRLRNHVTAPLPSVQIQGLKRKRLLSRTDLKLLEQKNQPVKATILYIFYTFLKSLTSVLTSMTYNRNPHLTAL